MATMQRQAKRPLPNRRQPLTCWPHDVNHADASSYPRASSRAIAGDALVGTVIENYKHAAREKVALHYAGGLPVVPAWPFK